MHNSKILLGRTGAITAVIAVISIYGIAQYQIGLGPVATLYWADGFWTMVSFAAALQSYQTARLSTNANDIRAWNLFALASLSWTVGMIVWSYYELVLGKVTPFPSAADFGFLGFAVFFVVGSLYLKDENYQRKITLKHFFNIGIVLVSVTAITIIVLHEPLHQTTESKYYIAVAMAYPIVYGTALMFSISWLWTSVSGRRRRAYAMMVIGLLFHTATDIIYSSMLLLRGYETGQPIDIYWIVGFGFIFLGATEATFARPNEKAEVGKTDLQNISYRIEKPVEALVPSLSFLSVLTMFYLYKNLSIDADIINILFVLGGSFVTLMIGREIWSYNHQRNIINELSISDKILTSTASELQTMLDTMADTFYRTDKNGNLIMLSKSVYDLLGYKPEEVIGRPISDFYVFPEKRDQFLNKLQASGGSLIGQEMDMRHKDGSIVWVSTNAHFVTDAEGNVVGVEGTTRDVTLQLEIRSNLDKAKAELEKRVLERTQELQNEVSNHMHTADSLRSSEEILSALLDSTVDYAALVDGDGNFIIANKVMAEIFGVDRKDLIGTPMFKTPMSKTGLRRKKWIDDVIATRQPIRSTDKQEGQWFDNSYFPVTNSAGEVKYVAIFARDITKQKLVEENLRQLMRAVEQDPNAIFITDLDGTIQYVNNRFTELTGYSAEEAIGKNPRILKSNNTPRETYSELWNAIKAGKEWRGEIMDRRKDGTHFWVNETIGPVRDESGAISHYVATHEDITPRKEAEITMKQAVEQSEIANRAKSELLANMSHELRTPLNAIIGFTGSIKAETFGPLGHEKYSEYINDISGSGQHLLELINDILDVSAIEAGKLELHEDPLVIEDLVEASVRLIQDRADHKNINLNVNVADSLPTLYADVRRMKQILLNLISNAIKFTPNDGMVTLSVTYDEARGHVFTIIDNGIGMNHVELAKAMSEFGQVDSGLNRKEEGTGLGLPLTKGLVELHGGTFDITSEKGKGTTVTIHLPKERSNVDG